MVMTSSRGAGTAELRSKFKDKLLAPRLNLNSLNRSRWRQREAGLCERLAQISHTVSNRSDRVGQTMDLLGEGLERNDAIVAAGIELAELLDVAESILWPDKH